MKKTFRKLFFTAFLMAMIMLIFSFGSSAATSGGFEYLVLNDNTVVITGYYGSTKNLVIPDKIAGKTVTRIGVLAFSDLTSVTIPAGVTSIFDGAFNDCNSLTSIYVDSGNKKYSSDSYGVLFNKNKTKLIQYPLGNTRTSYTIPSSVTSIGDYAFSSCDGLKNITIPAGVTSIGDWAFADCENLTGVTIPAGVRNIGEEAFLGCDFKTITIPSSVTSIGEGAFSYCDELTSIYVDSGNKNYSSDSYGVLFNKNKTKLIKYPSGNTRTSYTIPSGVTSIGEGAFYGCYNLKSITIPSGVTSIGEGAF